MVAVKCEDKVTSCDLGYGLFPNKQLCVKSLEILYDPFFSYLKSTQGMRMDELIQMIQV